MRLQHPSVDLTCMKLVTGMVLVARRYRRQQPGRSNELAFPNLTQRERIRPGRIRERCKSVQRH